MNFSEFLSRDREGDHEGDRGLTLPLEYTLGLAILLLAVFGLMTGFDAATEARQEAVVEQEADRIIQDFTHTIEQADRLTQQGYKAQSELAGSPPPEAVVGSTLLADFPSSIGQTTYTIHVYEDSGQYYVEIQTQSYSQITTLELSGSDPRVIIDEPITVSGGELRFETTYDSAIGAWVIEITSER